MLLFWLSILISQASAHYAAYYARSLVARRAADAVSSASSPTSTTSSSSSTSSSPSSSTDNSDGSDSGGISTGGKVLIGLFASALFIAFIVLAYVAYRHTNVRRQAAGYDDGAKSKHKGKSRARVVPTPHSAMIQVGEHESSPPPFLEPHMMTPGTSRTSEQFFVDTGDPSTSDTGVTLTSHGSPSSSRAPKRSFTIYGTQGPSTSSVDLSSQQGQQYPIGPEHHFMSAEYEHNYD